MVMYKIDIRGVGVQNSYTMTDPDGYNFIKKDFWTPPSSSPPINIVHASIKYNTRIYLSCDCSARPSSLFQPRRSALQPQRPAPQPVLAAALGPEIFITANLYSRTNLLISSYLLLVLPCVICICFYFQMSMKMFKSAGNLSKRVKCWILNSVLQEAKLRQTERYRK